MAKHKSESALRPEVARVSELGVTLVEELLDKVVRTDARTSRDEAVRNLTICGMTLATQHARGAIAEFAAGRPYSGMVLDRCMYEAIVRVMQWQRDPEHALFEWNALPVFAASEEQKYAGAATAMPAGVQRDLARFLATYPELADAKNDRRKLEKLARDAFEAEFGVNDKQVRDDIRSHIDVPSLFVHCRPLVAEDLFDGSDPDRMILRASSRMIEPNAFALEMVRILMLFARFVAAKTGFHPEPVDRVEAQWSEALRALSGDQSASPGKPPILPPDEL